MSKSRCSGSSSPPESEVRLDEERLADAALPQDVDERPVRRKEATPDRLHDEEPAAPRLLDHGRRLASVECERLFAQDVLPGAEESQSVGFVPRLRGGDVDDVDVGVGGQGVVVAVAGRNAEPVAEGRGTLGRARRHGHDGPAGGLRHGVGESRRDGTGPDDAPPDHAPVLRPRPRARCPGAGSRPSTSITTRPSTLSNVPPR